MAITKVDSSMYEDVSGANNLVKLDANAKIPAGAATNLTNLPGVIKSSSDPTVSSNKAVGTQWANTTSGEMYVCTDATAGANVWTNVGGGSGNIQVLFQGTSYGYINGGRVSSTSVDNIQKYSFTTDGNATDVANLTHAKSETSGMQSLTYGYTAGGNPGPGLYVIDKHQFATTNNATTVGNLVNNGRGGVGCNSSTHGYQSGGQSDQIQRFSFTTDGNSTDVGDITVARGAGVSAMTGHSDFNGGHGYNASGAGPVNVIDRYIFNSSNNSTDVGDMSVALDAAAGISSNTHGYSCGGYATGVGVKNTIQNLRLLQVQILLM